MIEGSAIILTNSVSYDSLKKNKLFLQCQLVVLFTFIMVDGPLSLPKWRISQCFHHKSLLSRDYITCLLKQFGLKPGMQIFISKRGSFAHNFKRREEE